MAKPPKAKVVYKWEVETYEGGVSAVVTEREDGVFACDCSGYDLRGRCRHIDHVVDNYNTLKPFYTNALAKPHPADIEGQAEERAAKTMEQITRNAPWRLNYAKPS